MPPFSVDGCHLGVMSFTDWRQAYRDHGLPVSMVSLQNEPHNCKTSYPTMLMKPADQAHLADELRPLLDANGFGSTGILAWDHNWSEKDPGTGENVLATFPQEAVELAEGTISAVGYHCYDKNPFGPEAQSEFHELRDDLIGPLNNWARTSLYWSLVLGSDGKPVLSTQGGCQDCRGMLSVDPETGGWTRSEDYYYWAQFSKFVKRGAERIASTPSPGQEIETTAFRNPDGSIVVVVLNPSSG
jgi:glucosylceramidase